MVSKKRNFCLKGQKTFLCVWEVTGRIRMKEFSGGVCHCTIRGELLPVKVSGMAGGGKGLGAPVLGTSNMAAWS